MTKIEIQTLYEVMFTDYPDIVNVAQVQAMLGISRHLAYGTLDGHSRRAYNKNGPKGCPFMCYPQRR